MQGEYEDRRWECAVCRWSFPSVAGLVQHEWGRFDHHNLRTFGRNLAIGCALAHARAVGEEFGYDKGYDDGYFNGACAGERNYG